MRSLRREPSRAFRMVSGRLDRLTGRLWASFRPFWKSKPNLVAMTTRCRYGCRGLPQQGFVAQGTVCFSRIEKGYPEFHGLLEQSYGFVLGKEGRIALRQSHAAVSKGRHFQAVVAKHSLFHIVLLCPADLVIIPVAAAGIPSIGECPTYGRDAFFKWGYLSVGVLCLSRSSTGTASSNTRWAIMSLVV